MFIIKALKYSTSRHYVEYSACNIKEYNKIKSKVIASQGLNDFKVIKHLCMYVYANLRREKPY